MIIFTNRDMYQCIPNLNSFENIMIKSDKTLKVVVGIGLWWDMIGQHREISGLCIWFVDSWQSNLYQQRNNIHLHSILMWNRPQALTQSSCSEHDKSWWVHWYNNFDTSIRDPVFMCHVVGSIFVYCPIPKLLRIAQLGLRNSFVGLRN